MYQSHWGFKEEPFRSKLDPRFFYASPVHEEALARLHFLVGQQRRLGLLLGGRGSGKSLLLDVFAAEMRRAGRPVATMSLLGMEKDEFLRHLAIEFGLNPAPGLPISSLWRMVTDRLAEYGYQRVDAVILLDDADWASPELSSQVYRLAQIEGSLDAQHTIVLAGQQDRIGQTWASLLDLAELRIDLGAWEASDTEAYLDNSLTRAGRDTPIFDDPAVMKLHELSHGVPRRISQLADLALAAGAGQTLDRIGAQTIESVYHELGVIEV
jgi:type II secretory pathway predicted ATPase ExeA